MNLMYFTCRSFSGHNESHNWSQYWENEPNDNTAKSTKGHLFGLINLTAADPSQNVSEVGHEIINFINNSYFSGDANTSAALNATLTSLQSHPVFSQLEISVILGVVVNNTIHLSLLGVGRVFLNRHHQLSQLLNGSANHLSHLQGQLNDLDRFVFVSAPFFAQFNLDYLQKVLVDSHLPTIEETILSDLTSLDDQNLVSAAIIQIHFEETEVVLPPPSPIESSEPSPVSLPVPTPSPSVTVNDTSSPIIKRRHRLNILIAVVFLICLSASVIISFRRNRQGNMEKQYQQLKSEITTKIDQSQKIRNLNLDQSRAVAQDAQKLLAQATALKIHADEISTLDNSIKSLLAQTGSSDSFTPASFFDTSLIHSNPQYSFIRFYSQKLLLLDTKNLQLDQLSIDQKSHRSISTDKELTNVSDITLDGDKIYALTNSGFIRLDSSGVKSLLTFDSSLTPSSVRLWNGSAYFLTSDNIFKSAPNNVGFDKPSAWLKTGQVLLPNVSSFAINGSIWTVTKTGQIQPFTHGQKEDYATSATLSVNNVSKLLTSVDLDNLIFVEGDSQIYVLNKTGQTQAKYNLGSLKILDIALDPLNKVIYALCSDQKIYKISL